MCLCNGLYNLYKIQFKIRIVLILNFFKLDIRVITVKGPICVLIINVKMVARVIQLT